jgi:hypothetical protein
MGCSPPFLTAAPKIEILQTRFVDKMISNVLHDLPFSQSQPLKSGDVWYIEF